MVRQLLPVQAMKCMTGERGGVKLHNLCEVEREIGLAVTFVVKCSPQRCVETFLIFIGGGGRSFDHLTNNCW